MIRRTDVKPGERHVYRRKDMQCVIDPASIALIGASPTPTSRVAFVALLRTR